MSAREVFLYRAVACSVLLSVVDLRFNHLERTPRHERVVVAVGAETALNIRCSARLSGTPFDRSDGNTVSSRKAKCMTGTTPSLSSPCYGTIVAWSTSSNAPHLYFQGGVTPSIGDIEATVSSLLKAESATRVHVLIRPRPGDFVYSTLEKQVVVFTFATH